MGATLSAGTQQLNVTFSPTDATAYTTATASVSLMVGKATPSINWPQPAAIAYGTALSATQLDATASVPGTFTCTPALGTTLSAGTQQLNVTFSPTDATDYNTATATVSLIVNKATPTISWPTPAAITYGTALSAAQLDATASVPGTFVYAPPAGTVPAVGSQTLSTTFNPTDSGDYTTSTASVTLVVNPAPVAATPVFSPAAGSYNAVQSITITDATVGATIYYTTNGTTPTTSSTVYSGAIAVNSTETIEAIAVATGYTQSPVASAAYTISLPADFGLAASPSSLSVAQGKSGTTTLTITPINGFNQVVTFACSNLPAETTCQFSPASVTPNGNPVTSLLTLTTTAPTTAMLANPARAKSIALLALLVGTFAGWRSKPRRLRMLPTWFAAFGLAAMLLSASGCGSGGTVTVSPGTPTGTAQVTVTATGGGRRQSSTPPA